MNLSEKAFVNRNMLNEKKQEFNKLFNLDLVNYLGGSLLSLVTGFDIVLFDEDIKTPDGISTKDFILQKYGKDAQKLVQYLIDN